MKCPDCGNELSENTTSNIRFDSTGQRSSVRTDITEYWCRRCGKTLPTTKASYAPNGTFIRFEQSAFLEALYPDKKEKPQDDYAI